MLLVVGHRVGERERVDRMESTMSRHRTCVRISGWKCFREVNKLDMLVSKVTGCVYIFAHQEKL